MSESINSDPIKSSSPSDSEELKQTCVALEAQVHTLRLVVLIAGVIMGLFFWREGNLNGAAVTQMQPQISQITQLMGQLEKQGGSYEKQMQGLQTIAMRLSEFGRSHPDYQPILAKYGIPVGNVPAAVPAAAKPAVAAPTAAPKK
jgi:hypothetical protein